MKKNPNKHRHNMPQWFKESELGIFIHWGLYSIPAFAPRCETNMHDVTKEKSHGYLIRNNPYAEWYLNSLRIKGTEVQEYHKKNYGDTPYEDFAKEFNKTAKNVDVEEWAESFKRAGAKYVIPVTKHHDGFVMYDTKVKNPRIEKYNLDFDFIGALAEACRKRDIKFGVYYSSILDWAFTTEPITKISSMVLSNDKSKEYADYCLNHWKELIDRYKPDILWSDIGYPADKRLPQLFEYYYSKVPEGIINDRWVQFPNILRNSILYPIFDFVGNILAKRIDPASVPLKYYDYRTTEYTANYKGKDYFEMCRGMDKSFGYNRNSIPSDYISADEVMTTINQLKSRKGRLLLNVGPDKMGKIPDYQKKILKDLAQLL